ncbi:MAG: CHAT domain-containing protein [Eubacterium sp.]|nr:CHAT domain-containing protein [Eubacterium sp.]
MNAEMYSREELYELLKSDISESEQFEIFIALALIHKDFNENEIRRLIEELLIDETINAEALSSAFFACIRLGNSHQYQHIFSDNKNISVHEILDPILYSDNYTIYDLIDIAAGALIIYGSGETCLKFLDSWFEYMNHLYSSYHYPPFMLAKNTRFQTTDIKTLDLQTTKNQNVDSKPIQIFTLFMLREWSVAEDIGRVGKYIETLDMNFIKQFIPENPGFFFECFVSIGNIINLEKSIDCNKIAVEIMNQYFVKNEDELIILYNIANTYYIMGKYLETNDYLDRIITKGENSPEECAYVLSLAYSLKAENVTVIKADNSEYAVDLLIKSRDYLDLIKSDDAYNVAYISLCKVASKVYLDMGDIKRGESFANDLCRAYEEGFAGIDDYLVGLNNLAIAFRKQGLKPKSRETLEKAIRLVEENNLQNTNVGIIIYNTKKALFTENKTSLIQEAYDTLRNCSSVNGVNFYTVVNAVSITVSYEKRKYRVESLLINAIKCLEEYISVVEDKNLIAQYYITRSLIEGYLCNFYLSAEFVKKAISVERESDYSVDVVMINLGLHGDIYMHVFNSAEFKAVLMDVIRGFPHRAWEMLKLSDEMSLFKGLSRLSEYYKFVLSEHYLRRIHLTDEEFVEISVNCKNIYSDILGVRGEVENMNPWYEEEYEEVNKLHRTIINLQLGKFFNHEESEARIESLKDERHEKELQLMEDQPYKRLHWMNIDEIASHLPDNVIYIDYIVMPPVEVNRDAYIKDLVYNRFVLVKANGQLRIKILPYQNLLKIRYQFEILEKLLREKYGKESIYSLGRILRGDNAVLINLYRTLFKEAIDFARKLNIVPKTIIISGDAELSSFPYDALIDEQGKYLVEKYEIVTVNSLRNYKGEVKLEEGDTENAVVIGNPSFTMDLSVTQNSDDDKYLVQIPLSKIEAQAVADTIGVRPLLRSDAKKSVLIDNDCRILHIATHGDHLEADYANEMTGDWIEGNVTNPLLTNCIFMSGANDWIVKNEIDERYGNGIITAEEFSTYKLPKLKVVTMSACFTGSGDINYQLGLIGMRTALMATGARAIITNLWEVDDFASAVFMTRFYNNLKTMTVSAALREAKLYLMSVTLKDLTIDGWFGESRIRRLGLVAEDMRKLSEKPPGTKLFEKPFYWGGFTLLNQ